MTKAWRLLVPVVLSALFLSSLSLTFPPLLLPSSRGVDGKVPTKLEPHGHGLTSKREAKERELEEETVGLTRRLQLTEAGGSLHVPLPVVTHTVAVVEVQAVTFYEPRSALCDVVLGVADTRKREQALEQATPTLFHGRSVFELLPTPPISYVTGRVVLLLGHTGAGKRRAESLRWASVRNGAGRVNSVKLIDCPSCSEEKEKKAAVRPKELAGLVEGPVLTDRVPGTVLGEPALVPMLFVVPPKGDGLLLCGPRGASRLLLRPYNPTETAATPLQGHLALGVALAAVTTRANPRSSCSFCYRRSINNGLHFLDASGYNLLDAYTKFRKNPTSVSQSTHGSEEHRHAKAVEVQIMGGTVVKTCPTN
ncbi:hypothetical protein FIBSPDRAFT_890321 [Athelia psychrophila]|uniref:Uncharacterized protein n=1 Tax=Athelia psychrophila TaxID=1759441 RepID=A0A166L009_9AGAM|nr:hypothetical protein FIBSPDRAFT_890321 [Fibularhizoctonia sp. CBS 109695]